MAEIKFLKLFTAISDGTAYSSSNYTNAGIRLRDSDSDGSDNGEYTGNTVISGDFTEVGNGYWYINIDESDSGLYRIEYYDNDSTAWRYIDGASPIKIDLTNYISKDIADTKTGNLNMTGYDLTVQNIDLDSPSSTIGSGATSVELQNIMDKTANQDITGTPNFTGGLQISGTSVNATAAEINKLDGVEEIYDIKAGMNRGGRASISTNTSLTATYNGGFVPVSSPTGTTITLTLPEASATNAGLIFTIVQVNNSTPGDIDVDTISTDEIVPTDGTIASSGTTCTTGDKYGEGVVLMSSGYKYWYVLGGAAYSLV